MDTPLPDGLERIDCDGLSVLAAGPRAAPPMVLLHGIGSNALSFAALIGKLAGARRLYAWDAPGYGRSNPLAAAAPTPDDYAAALGRALGRLGVSRMELVGHSLGCLVAGRFAASHPEVVTRLALLSPASGHRTTPGGALSTNAQGRLDGLRAEGAQAFAAKRGPNLVFDKTGKPDVVAAVTRAMSEVSLPGYAQACHLLSCGDLVAEAARIRTPTLVAVGDHDTVTPPEGCRKVYDALLAATPALGHRFELVPAAGHAVVQEQAAAVAAVLGPPAPNASGGNAKG